MSFLVVATLLAIVAQVFFFEVLNQDPRIAITMRAQMIMSQTYVGSPDKEGQCITSEQPVPSIPRNENSWDVCRKSPNEGTAVSPEGIHEFHEISRHQHPPFPGPFYDRVSGDVVIEPTASDAQRKAKGPYRVANGIGPSSKLCGSVSQPT